MGKSEDKIKYKQNKKSTALMIIGIAVVVLLIVFIFFGTAISDFVRNIFAKDSGAGSGDDISSSAVDSGETDDSGDETDGDRAGYPADETQLSPDYQLAAPTAGDDIAIITTSLGTMKFKLFPENAPKAVANFSAKAQDGYYNGKSFLYLYEDVLQSDGDMNTIYGEEGFEKELSINLHNYLGALGVCNSGDVNSNQFYIVTVNNVAEDILEAMSGEQAQSLGLGFSEEVIAKYASIGGDPTLDGQFTVFGQLYEGAEVIDAINAVQVDEDYKPLQDITITSVEIGKY